MILVADMKDIASRALQFPIFLHTRVPYVLKCEEHSTRDYFLLKIRNLIARVCYEAPAKER